MSDGAGVPTGTPLAEPPLIEMISEDPVLRDTKLIAEAWDCDGLNQVVHQQWSALAWQPLPPPPPSTSSQRTTASPWQIWWPTTTSTTRPTGRTTATGRATTTAGTAGEEGDTQQWGVKRLRQRQMRNMCIALLVAHGVPMITMGDEYAHTKRGNNNTYCHDDPLNWFDWGRSEADEGGFSRFMRCMVNFRRSRPELQRSTFVGTRDVQWHGELPDTPDWTETSRLVAYTTNDGAGNGLFIAFNTGHTARALKLPKWPGKVWQRVADTSQLAPYDFLLADEVLSQDELARVQAACMMWSADRHCAMLPWSAVILESVPEAAAEALKAPDV
ncbi:hypothetical protein QJQ45_029637 [Haematococcus lacustris]|nr:hypothetical protein QJQ45_029637 [Haematococcus lacustris]